MVAIPARNPFYVLLILVGVAFVVTACAYGVMSYRDVAIDETTEPATSGLMQFMDQYGMMVLGIEVALLGLFTVGAIGTDEFWQRRLQQGTTAGSRQNDQEIMERDKSHEDPKSN